MKRKIKIAKRELSHSQQFRNKWYKKGYELIDITKLCEFKLGYSGWCNDFNEPEESIYHIQVWYRGEVIANFNGDSCYPIDDNKHIIFKTNLDDVTGSDFIIFRKVIKE